MRTLLPPNLRNLTVNKCNDTLAQSLQRVERAVRTRESLHVVRLLLDVPGRTYAVSLCEALEQYFDIPYDLDGNPEGWKIVRQVKEDVSSEN